MTAVFVRRGVTFGGLSGNTSPRKDGDRDLEHHVETGSCDNGAECDAPGVGASASREC